MAVRDLGEGTCERERRIVAEEARGTGAGRRLGDRLPAEARAAGAARMRLDASHLRTAARRLHESAGFRRIPPYRQPPEGRRDRLLPGGRDL